MFLLFLLLTLTALPSVYPGCQRTFLFFALSLSYCSSFYLPWVSEDLSLLCSLSLSLTALPSIYPGCQRSFLFLLLSLTALSSIYPGCQRSFLFFALSLSYSSSFYLRWYMHHLENSPNGSSIFVVVNCMLIVTYLSWVSVCTVQCYTNATTKSSSEKTIQKCNISLFWKHRNIRLPFFQPSNVYIIGIAILMHSDSYTHFFNGLFSYYCCCVGECVCVCGVGAGVGVGGGGEKKKRLISNCGGES